MLPACSPPGATVRRFGAWPDNGWMRDIRWDEVREWFDPYENGSAPDVIVPDMSLADWETLFRLIRSKGWRCDYEFRDQMLPLPPSPAELFIRDPEGWLRTIRVWPDPDLEWIVRPWSTDEIDSDVSLFEIQGQERLDVLCGFLRTLGSALGKRVVMYAEGFHRDPPMLAYEVDDDRVVFLAGPWH